MSNRRLPREIAHKFLRIPRWIGSWWQTQMQGTQRVTSAFFTTLLLLVVVYRLAMLSVLGAPSASGAARVAPPFWVGLQFLGYDLVLVGWLAGSCWLLVRLSQGWRRFSWGWLLDTLLLVTVHLFLLAVFLIVTIHQQLMASMRTGLTFDVIIESTAGDMWFTLKAIPPWSLLLVLIPWTLFWLLLAFPQRWRIWRDRMVALICVEILLMQMIPAHASTRTMGPEYRENPVLFAVKDVVQSMRRSRKSQSHLAADSPKPSRNKPGKRSSLTQGKQRSTLLQKIRANQLQPKDLTKKQLYALCVPSQSQRATPASLPNVTLLQRGTKGNHARSKAPIVRSGSGSFVTELVLPEQIVGPLPRRASAAQMRSLRLIDSIWVDNQKTIKRLPALRQKWNVLIILLESTGYQYLFDTKRGNRVPMPFLKKLTKEGWWMRKHFSPSNSSPRSAFSLMSGLYPRPRMRMFSTRKDAFVPSLATLFGPGYESFLVNPSPLRWFFPRGFLHNSGLRELYGYHSIPVKKKAPNAAWSRDERLSLKFFIKRMNAAKEPFFGTYWSFVAHWPYPDYGPGTHIFKNTRRSINRYYNNLALMDQNIKQLFDALKKSGRLERTIVVITGDHGEAFGQHRGNWAHSRRSYNENYQIPGLIWQPKLFGPRTIDFYTSHVDIVPTLLDAMHIQYNPELIQGESLWQNRLRRRYIFLYGNENTLSTISYAGIKLQYSYKKQKCWVYNLKEDPLEKRRLSCRPHSVQRRATLLWHRYQYNILEQYNRASRQRRSFFGATHNKP